MRLLCICLFVIVMVMVVVFWVGWGVFFGIVLWCE